MEPPTFVIDASAAALRILTDDRTPLYEAWLGRVWELGAGLIAPSLIRYELANLVFDRYREPAHRHNASLLADLVQDATVGIEMVDDAWAYAWPWAGRLGAADAAYVGLAQASGSTLVTYDPRLAELAATHVPVTMPGVESTLG